MLPDFRYRAVMADGTVENGSAPVFAGRLLGRLDLDADEVHETEWRPWGVVRDEVAAGTSGLSPWAVSQVAALPADPMSAEEGAWDAPASAARP